MPLLPVLVFLSFCTVWDSYGQSPSNGTNHIMHSVPRRAYRSVAQLEGKPVDSVNSEIRYFDGLGRVLQTVQWQGSPSKKDVVQHMEYDSLGRMSRNYLPYAAQTGNNGAFRPSARGEQSSYYSSSGWDADVVKTAFPYSHVVFDRSPRDRVQEQGAPGAVWQPHVSRGAAEGRTVLSEYLINRLSDGVRLWRITTSGADGTTSYAAGKLYKTVLKDENWESGRSGTSEEYTDTDGRVVLKRAWKTETEALDSYYVYNAVGNLCYVVPPGYTSDVISDIGVSFDELVYAYRYDVFNRLAEKKIPGRGWEWIVYDAADRPILTQDAVQRTKNEWHYTKYDMYGRVTTTGIYTAAYVDRLAAQSAADEHLTLNGGVRWESRFDSLYTNLTFPNSALYPLLVNYYDNYSFAGSYLLPESGVIRSDKTRRLQTATLVYKDDGTAPLLTINYYDDKARLIQSVSQNHLGGTDRITNTYSFVGELETSRRVHKAYGDSTVIFTKNEYDHVGRLVATKHKINNQDEVTLSKNEYNEIGQLSGKHLHYSAASTVSATEHLDGNDIVLAGANREVVASSSIILKSGFHAQEGSTFKASIVEGASMQHIQYAYNERGWMTENNSAEFKQSLKYNQPNGLGQAQYNGNISEVHYGHGTTADQYYYYSYDALNRLLDGNSPYNGKREQMSYDVMGNIESLTRDGGTPISYNYMLGAVKTNRLQSLSGGLSGSYSYDGNGNALSDRTGMAFTYNQLNLPVTASKTGTSVSYLYDATGVKLKKTSDIGSQHSVRDYIDGIEYYEDLSTTKAIQRIATSEGYIENNGGVYSYHYNITDHLGNVRAVLQKTGVPGYDVVQRSDYYPFGKRQANSSFSFGNNRYLYNGKELQDELDGQYDYGARFYDAEIGRWNVVDPLAEDYMHWSPYNYAMNSPLVYIDPDGMAAEGYFTRYIDPNGNTILNTDDGREDVVMVPWNRMEQFLENAYWTDKSPLTDIGSKGWNDHWRSEFGIHIKESTLNYAGHHFLETEAARAAQVKYLVTGKASDFRDFVNKRVSASWNFANIVSAVSATGTLLSQSVQFGKVPNQIHHAQRYLIEKGINVQAVQNAIRNDLSPNIFYQTGVRIQGSVVVDNVVIKYSGTKLPNGKINIGTIQPPR